MPAEPIRPGLIRAVAAREPGRLVLLGLMMLLRMGLGLATPVLLAAALHNLTVPPEVTGGLTRDARSSIVDHLGGPVVSLALVVLLLGATELIMGLVSASMSSGVTVWLQTHMVRHLLRLGDRSSFAPGEATARVAQGAATANLPYALLGVGASLLSSSVALVVLWLLDWRAGLTFTMALPLVVFIARRFVGGMTSAQSAYLSAQSNIAATLLSALAGARTIRAAGTVDVEVARVLRPLPALHSAGRALWLRQRRVVWQLNLLVPIAQVLTVAVAGLGVAAGRVAPTDLIAVWGYLAMASAALSQIDALAEVAYVRAGTARLAEILDQPVPADGAATLPAGPGAVCWRAVTVGRPGADAVLTGFDLDLSAGVATAFVGRSGAGKSLAAALIGRLVDPDAGRVLLDGVPVTELSLAELRAAVTYAFDRPALVGETVRDAIRYGRSTIDDDDVVTAARAARADTFIRRLPEGYDTMLARAPMSGGERQRLGLARALVRAARVYVLDDATSGLDTVTEAEVTQAITTMLAGRTRVVVAHRAATAAACEQVVWFDGGRVRATGPHAELWCDPDYRAVFADPMSHVDVDEMVGATRG